uniref:Centrosomal protein 43 n=2 Tax=Nothobranchius furzeri TaxID=105023 RepID=A0A8C6KK35_NOTFU
MSAAEDDTELRDLLIQNLENSGVLNKLKAEMRAAVFLAMEDQDRLENKSPLVNENLNKCLNSKDGRLVASLIMDFLQVFNLDFSLAVFQPEINSLNGLDSRELVCRELGLSDSEQNQNSPLLLELIRRNRHGDKRAVPTKVRWFCSGVLPGRPRTEAETDVYVLFVSSGPEGEPTVSLERASSLGQPDLQQSNNRTASSAVRKESLDLEGEEDHDEGDSFFDDPLPEPQKTYANMQRQWRGNGVFVFLFVKLKLRFPVSTDDDVEYDDDFNSHRSDLSNGELSIGEEIEEVSIEGPENSDKFDESTQDLSVSQLSQSNVADYMEDVS